MPKRMGRGKSGSFPQDPRSPPQAGPPSALRQFACYCPGLPWLPDPGLTQALKWCKKPPQGREKGLTDEPRTSPAGAGDSSNLTSAGGQMDGWGALGSPCWA